MPLMRTQALLNQAVAAGKPLAYVGQGTTQSPPPPQTHWPMEKLQVAWGFALRPWHSRSFAQPQAG